VITIYPLKFLPVYIERIWGGNKLASIFGRELPSNGIGESWELSTHDNAMSIVKNGVFAGKSLRELVLLYKEQLMGKDALHQPDFPLLIKFIDAAHDLSVQVHPNDDDAFRMEGGIGKTEAWYVLQAEEQAKIVYGLQPGVTKDDFIRAVHSNIMDVLRVVPVKAGDMIYVPAGTVHALCGGLLVCEIQQTSDITYRIHDYGRVGNDGKTRELHIDKAMQVINYDRQLDTDFSHNVLSCSLFKMEKMCIEGQQQQSTEGHFVILCVIEGCGEILYHQGTEPIQKGETILIPACMGSFCIRGNVEVLTITSNGKNS